MLPEDLLTKSIVEQVLKTDVSEKAELVNFKIENCTEDGANFTNAIKKLILIYKLNGKRDELERQTSYIAKLNPCKDRDEFNTYRFRAMQKEVFFYEKLLPLLNNELRKINQLDLKVPRYILSVIAFGKEVIIFEDLNNKGFETLPNDAKLDEHHTRIMVEEICKLHVAGIKLAENLRPEAVDGDLSKIFPLITESLILEESSLNDAFKSVIKKGIDLNLALVEILSEYKSLVPWVRDLKEYSMKALTNELISDRNPKVLCHGDFHRSNVLFRYGQNGSAVPQDVRIIDWQTLRMADVSTEFGVLLYSSFHDTSFREAESEITESYCYSMERILGSNNSYISKSEFEETLRKNNFGFLLCFYLVPLSLVLGNPSELFEVKRKEAVSKEMAQQTECAKRDATYNPREILQTNVKLKKIFIKYLTEIKEKGIDNSISVMDFDRSE